MYKVLIADDESIIRNALAGAFAWDEYGMEVVALARNGLEAYEMAKLHHPDICLLDIQMPQLNGLELIGKINEIDSSILKIIISGHDEFDYARKAIQLGVYNYILKPIDEDDFAKMLTDIKKQLDDKNLTNEALKKRETLLDAGKEVLRDEMLSEWLHGQRPVVSDGGTAADVLKELGVRLTDHTGLLWVHLTYPVSMLDKEDVKEEQLRLCRRRLEKHFDGDDTFCFIRLFSDRFVLLMDAADCERWNGIKQELSPMIRCGKELSIMMQTARVAAATDDISQAFLELNEQSAKELRFLPMVKRIKKHVDENYQDMQLRLSTFAEKNHISASYLSKIFKNETGVSFIDYLIQYRIMRSLELLTGTSLKIRDISERVGYSSQHYYCEAFKKVMGMAPTEYRRRKQ